jgi:hypothetical protein
LRNIRSPIIVFGSWGDNITPPQQALNWIPDLYDNAGQIRENEQTIIYVLHEKIGHLGIFVSSGVATREHSELASALDLIDILPPGLYEAVIIDSHPDMPGLEYVEGRYVIRFEPREVGDILAIDDGREDERAFEVVRRVSQVNQALYDYFVSPWVIACTTEQTATAGRDLNWARLERQLFSDENFSLKLLQPLAESIRRQRKIVADDNPFLSVEKLLSAFIGSAWDTYRDVRDMASEQLFLVIYDAPLAKALAGFPVGSSHLAQARGRTWEQQEMLRLKAEEHATWFERGTPESGFLRLLIYVSSGSGVVDKRPFTGIRRIMRDFGLDKSVSLAQLKDAIKRETFLVRMDEKRALDGLLILLPNKKQRLRALRLARELLVMGGPISAEKEARLSRVAHVLQV